jgi:ABC-type antimicrobial peptide transport system permease subunit
LDLLITKIEDVLRSRHNIDDPEKDDFSVTSMKEAREIINEVFVVLNILLIGLTSVSLVVGGVGIMNVMYVAVTERTFEIGLRKAVGARKGDIVKQFLLEALFLTTMGGMIGLIFALLFIEIAEWTASQLGFALNFPVSWFSILLALGFSLLVGVIFGYKPARKAGEMQSMEAMRKE